MQKSEEFEGQMDSSQRLSTVINFSADNDNDDLEFSFPVPEPGHEICPASPIFNHNILPIRTSKSEEEKEKPPLLSISSLDGIPDKTCCISTPVKKRYKKKRAMKSWSSSLMSGLRNLAVVVTDVVSYNKEITEKEKLEIKLKKSASANKIKGKASLPARREYLVPGPERRRKVMKAHRQVYASRGKQHDKATGSRRCSYLPFKKTIINICADVNVSNGFRA